MVSFPPLIDMLKFSGYPYLIRGQTENQRRMRQPRGPALVRTICYAQDQPPDADAFQASPAADMRGTAAQHQAALEECNDARTGMPFGMPKGAMCVQRFDDSLNSAIHTTYRISLRSSSMPEPRDPLLKVLISNCVCFAQTTQLPQSVWLGSIDGRTRRGNKKGACTQGWVGALARPA